MTTELANPRHPTLTIAREDAVKTLCARIDEGVKLRKSRIWTVGQLDKAREAKQEWTHVVTKFLTQLFARDDEAEQFNRWAGKILPEFANLGQFIDRFHDEMDQRLKNLVALLKRVEAQPSTARNQAEIQATQDAEKMVEAVSQDDNATPGTQPLEPAEEITVTEIAKNPATEKSPTAPHGTTRSGALILHLRDEAAEELIAKFLTTLGYELVVVGIDEVGTKALVQKLGGQRGLEFAILLTGQQQNPAATDKENTDQRSMSWDFELGYCAGRLGAGRVCVLHVGGLSVSYDQHGLLHIPVDPADGWQLHVARQLKRAGIQVDLNRLV